MMHFEATSVMPVEAEELFAWHARPGAFERLAPPWETIRIVEKRGGIEDGARLVMDLVKGPLRIRWVARHRDFVAGRQFCDEQVRGPFATWIHTHRVAPDPNGSVLRDMVQYELPFGWPVRALAGGPTRRMLQRMFDHRHDRTRRDLERHAKFEDGPKLRVAISGASGLIGSQLAAFLSTGGHDVVRLVRSSKGLKEGDILWNPDEERVDAAALEGVDAVVHLAGENIAGGRWSAERKQRVFDSRVRGTKTIASALAGLARKPKVLVVASAIGYYGARGDEIVTEESEPGEGYLSDVCRAWEAAAAPAEEAGIRVVKLRIGIVLAASGGALGKMLLPFKMGLGGVLGSGDQYMSWIALDDVVGLAHHAIMDEKMSGPVNATAPNPVTNRVFTKTLGRVLGRPTVLPVPSFAIRAMFGEMGNTLLLQGSRAMPTRAQALGFEFTCPELAEGIRRELGAGKLGY